MHTTETMIEKSREERYANESEIQIVEKPSEQPRVIAKSGCTTIETPRHEHIGGAQPGKPGVENSSRETSELTQMEKAIPESSRQNVPVDALRGQIIGHPSQESGVVAQSAGTPGGTQPVAERSELEHLVLIPAFHLSRKEF